MGTPRSVVVRMTPMEADAVADALSYYSLVASDNFGMGCNGYPEELKAATRAVRVLDRLSKLLETE